VFEIFYLNLTRLKDSGFKNHCRDLELAELSEYAGFPPSLKEKHLQFPTSPVTT